MFKINWICCIFLCVCLCPMTGYGQDLATHSKSALLMECSSGTVLWENNSHERLPMASVTKIMTMLLGIEAIENGNISMEDMVTVSETASRMTGSRVFLSINETISVHDLFKSIAVASGNDAAVCLAEYLAGSEENFVKRMNQRANELGLSDTQFVNCTGLDAEGHYSSASDLAVLSRELLQHDEIREFLSIWMDSLRDGTFTLSNTNKLIRFYEGATGVKTGSTDEALFCMSASAKREGMELIAVVMGAPTSKERFADASGLLNYGFAGYTVEPGVQKEELITGIAVEKGMKDFINVVSAEDYAPVIEKEKKGQVVRDIQIEERIAAPVLAGQKIGEMIFRVGDTELKRIDLLAEEDVKKAGLVRMYGILLRQWLG